MNRFCSLVAIVICCAFVTTAFPASGDITVQSAMDFETQGAWITEADLPSEFNEPDLYCSLTTTYAKLANGAAISTEYVKAGKYSYKWEHHPYFPSLSCKHVAPDWSKYNAVSFWCYSKQKTNENVFLAIDSDNPKTVWKDFFFTHFRVDWTGWKQITVPFNDFIRYGKVIGWNKIDRINFYTKIFDQQPNPYTVIYLDQMQLVADPHNSIASFDPNIDDQRLAPYLDNKKQELAAFDPNILNHGFPETRDNKPAYTPIKYEPYFKAERALLDYYPQFMPGPVSFDTRGKAYIRYNTVIQSLNENGKWIYQDLQPAIGKFVKDTLHFYDYQISAGGFYDDMMIRFDKDNDAYVNIVVRHRDPNNKVVELVGLLLHSRDNLKTWTAYKLPYWCVRFEKLDGHNQDCLNRPPLMIGSSSNTEGGGSTLVIIAPEKQPDGTLVIGEGIKIIDDVGICVYTHSGDGNFMVTHGDKVFLVFGVVGNKTKWPSIPEKHPAKEFTYISSNTTEKVATRNGTPAYAVVYDLKTKQVSKPVFLGFGGIVVDAHNWPSITVDGKGILHVLINGHHSKLMYTASQKPYDIETWTAPELVSDGTSYTTINCDSNDTIYAVTRNSRQGYYFTLALSRKKTGQNWEEDNYLVRNFEPYYKVFWNKMCLDTKRNRLFLAYFSQTKILQVFRDDFDAYLFMYPDREKWFLTNISPEYYMIHEEGVHPIGTYKTKPNKIEFYLPLRGPCEPCLLVSEDRGNTWRLAVTNDFK